MELIIGGAFQGKKEYAKAHCKIDTSQMILGESADYEDIFSCKCVCHFHEWVKRF